MMNSMQKNLRIFKNPTQNHVQEYKNKNHPFPILHLEINY